VSGGDDRVRFSRAPDLLTRSFAGRVILAAPGDEEIHALSGTAGVIWELFAQPRTRTETSTILSEAFDVPLGEILPQVDELIRQLVARNLLQELA
jgi:hypothetical protein